jgi:hypothetical protein
MQTIKRHEWGARAPRNRTPLTNQVRGVALHWVGVKVTGDPLKIVKGIQTYHQETRGWFDIAYNMCISQDGRAIEGRGWRTRSGANGSSKLNRHYAAILCLIGPDQKPTDEMVDAIRDQIASFRRVFPKATEIVAHGNLQATACPGNDIKGLIDIGAFDPAHPPKDGEAVVVTSGYPLPSRILKRGSTGDDVRWVQSKLNIKGARPQLLVDGIFGARTQRAVKRIQKNNQPQAGPVDGIVGPMTLAIMRRGSSWRK